jgi:hypothetical protein
MGKGFIAFLILAASFVALTGAQRGNVPVVPITPSYISGSGVPVGPIISAFGIQATNFISNGGTISFLGGEFFQGGGNGKLSFGQNSGALRLSFNTGTAVPTISSGFGASPSVVAGSINSVGTINVGTGGAATQGIVAFGAPAWTTAPKCTATVQTATLADARYHAVTTTTTTMTVTANAAWLASSIVNWICFGSEA